MAGRGLSRAHRFQQREEDDMCKECGCETANDKTPEKK